MKWILIFQTSWSFTTSPYKLPSQTLFINILKNSLYHTWYECTHVQILILYGKVGPAWLSYSNHVWQVKSITIREHLSSWSLIFNLLEKLNILFLPKEMLRLLRKVWMHSDLSVHNYHSHQHNQTIIHNIHHIQPKVNWSNKLIR